MKPILIGVDLGTTWTKATAFDTNLKQLSTAERATPWTIRGRYVEADPIVLADTAVAVIAEVAANTEGRAVAVGVAGIAESGVLLDRSDQPVAPTIAWHDPRGAVDEIAAALPDFSGITGLKTSPVASVMKLPMLVSRAQRPARRWCSIPEWIVLRLGGDFTSEISLACRTGLYDLHRRDWWPDALAVAGLTQDHLAPPSLGIDGAGLATAAGIEGARLVVAGHDHQVAAFGASATDAGSLFDSLGTAEALLRFVSAPAPPPDVVRGLVDDGISVGYTVVPDRLALLGGLRSGQTLERIAKLIGATDRATRMKVAERAIDVPLHPELNIIPGTGSLTIEGITDDVDSAVLWRAAVEAADAATVPFLDRFDQLWGPPTRVTITGGWLNDPMMRLLKSKRFPDFVNAPPRSGTFGAATIAGIAAGVLEMDSGSSSGAAGPNIGTVSTSNLVERGTNDTATA